MRRPSEDRLCRQTVLTAPGCCRVVVIPSRPEQFQNFHVLRAHMYRYFHTATLRFIYSMSVPAASGITFVEMLHFCGQAHARQYGSSCRCTVSCLVHGWKSNDGNAKEPPRAFLLFLYCPCNILMPLRSLWVVGFMFFRHRCGALGLLMNLRIYVNVHLS